MNATEQETSLVVVLLGPPGAGKGTQCKLLAKALGLRHISTGDLLREYASSHSEMGRRVKAFIDAGILVPDQLVMNMLEERTSQRDCCHGLILDGFPRTEAQASLLERSLSLNHKGFDLRVLRLIVPESVLMARIASRLTCSTCGAIYSLDSRPPIRPSVCDVDGGHLTLRIDDQSFIYRERLRTYEAQIPTLLRYYRERGTVIDVDGNGSVEEVAERLIRMIQSAHSDQNRPGPSDSGVHPPHRCDG